jgi:glycosyltransferase involved in cell wall biosynthesis
MASVSVIVITYNEENNIDRCLGSLDFADEIIMVDSFSTDSTLEKARKYTDKIIQHKYDGDIPQRIRGFNAAHGDWLMYIDADEEVSSELKNEIKNAITNNKSTDGYYIVRKVYAFGKWIMHGGWFPDHTFRLFRRDKYIPEYAEVHGGFAARGRTEILKGFLWHYSYPDISSYLRKMNDYTSLQVSNKLKSEKVKSVGITKIVFSPAFHFFRRYFSQKGYKDGKAGFILAVLSSISTLTLYSKLWEYLHKQRNGMELPPITNTEIRFLKENYYSE